MVLGNNNKIIVQFFFPPYYTLSQTPKSVKNLEKSKGVQLLAFSDLQLFILSIPYHLWT
jgi:hypothetical protein